MAIEGLTKRKYKYRSKNKGGKWGYTIAIVVSIIAYLLIWFYL